jgi:arylsulfatase A-like enzyme
LYDPHYPFDAPASLLQRYLDRLDDLPLPNYTPGELDTKPRFQFINHHTLDKGSAGFKYDSMSDRDHRVVRASYFAMCDLVDQAAGTMLGALDETGQARDTLVIFMSDHGEMLGDHGIYLKGPFFYEPAVRVPLILRWPGGLGGGRRITDLTELTDIVPTLLDFASLPIPASVQGRSLRPTLPDPHVTPAREDVYCEYLNAMPDHAQPTATCTMLRTTRYKLVVCHGVEPGELYDLDQDPQETQNLWDDPSYTTLKIKLLKKLCDRIAFTADPLPVRNAPY